MYSLKWTLDRKAGMAKEAGIIQDNSHWPITDYRGITEARATQLSPGVSVVGPAGGRGGVRRLAVAGCDSRHCGGAGEMIS